MGLFNWRECFFIKEYQYSQGYFDYSLTEDPLKALHFEKDNDLYFCTKCLTTEKIKFKIETYKIEMSKA